MVNRGGKDKSVLAYIRVRVEGRAYFVNFIAFKQQKLTTFKCLFSHGVYWVITNLNIILFFGVNVDDSCYDI